MRPYRMPTLLADNDAPLRRNMKKLIHCLGDGWGLVQIRILIIGSSVAVGDGMLRFGLCAPGYNADDWSWHPPSTLECDVFVCCTCLNPPKSKKSKECLWKRWSSALTWAWNHRDRGRQSFVTQPPWFFVSEPPGSPPSRYRLHPIFVTQPSVTSVYRIEKINPKKIKEIFLSNNCINNLIIILLLSILYS